LRYDVVVIATKGLQHSSLAIIKSSRLGHAFVGLHRGAHVSSKEQVLRLRVIARLRWVVAGFDQADIASCSRPFALLETHVLVDPVRVLHLASGRGVDDRRAILYRGRPIVQLAHLARTVHQLAFCVLFNNCPPAIRSLFLIDFRIAR